MTHTYTITGMTCMACEAKVKYLLNLVEGVVSAEVSKDTSSGTISMKHHIPVDTLQEALGGTESKYRIISQHHHEASQLSHDDTKTKSWAVTYKPILLIFGYITGLTLLIQAANQNFDVMQAMRHFMAGFFLVFSFFKLLNIKGFAESYAMYDVIARKIPVWGYVYAFTELVLGIAFLMNFNPFVTNLVTLVVMLVSIVGVLQSVLNKRKIQCACLGAVFNLPMSTVTIIEDALMIAMSLAMLFLI